MKKIFFALSMLALLYTSCDPSSDDGATGFMENVTAENVQASVTPVQVDGKNTNLIIVENHSPITQQWTADQLAEKQTLSSKAYDTIYVTHTGVNVVKLTCKNIAGEFTKDYTVNVDQIYYLSDELQKRLNVDTEKSKVGHYVSKINGQQVQFTNDFDPNKVKVTQEIGPNGELGNKFTLVNENPVLSDWKISNDEVGDATANLNSDALLVGDAGHEYTLTLTYTKADGTQAVGYEKKFRVDALTTIPELFTYLAGADGTGTTWEWNSFAGNVWGNGPATSGDKPAWWGVSYDDISGQGGSKVGGISRNGKDAWFKIDWKNKVATSSDASVAPVKFKVNPLEHKTGAESGWDLGTITFESTDDNFVVPMGVDVNNGNKAFQKYYVLKASGKRLVLVAPTTKGNDAEGWFYMFKEKE